MNLAARIRKFSLRNYPLRIALLIPIYALVLIVSLAMFVWLVGRRWFRALNIEFWDFVAFHQELFEEFTPAGFKAARKREGL